MTQPLKWHGGKHYLAKRIIAEFPPHIHYVEPYFGGGSVLLQKPLEWVNGHSEVVNDINGELMNFWESLRKRDRFDEFCREVSAIPFSEGAFSWTQNKGLDPVHRAVVFFVKYRQSRQGLGKDFATLSRNRTRRGMNEQVSSWLTAIDGLPEIHERLKRVVILSNDALKVIRSQDGPNTLFYLDPPYIHKSRETTGEYEFEMDEPDHCDLLETISHINGKFILSGYKSDIYDEWERANGWRRVDIEIDNKASGRSIKEIKTERLWMNF